MRTKRDGTHATRLAQRVFACEVPLFDTPVFHPQPVAFDREAKGLPVLFVNLGLFFPSSKAVVFAEHEARVTGPFVTDRGHGKGMGRGYWVPVMV